ncbi:MAG: hypothetical protein NHB32_20630 [Fischerella sp. CENA71]|nr:hypothetical protein [Fischerella sp. CENA71]
MPKAAKRNSDHAQRHNTPSINNEAISQQLEALLTPAIFAQQKYYKQLGLRDRVLNLSLMVAVVLTLLWRQVPGVQELTRLLAREDLLWCRATTIAQKSLSERFLVFPSELFERVFKDLIPQLHLNWQQRLRRPLPDSIKFTLKHFDRIWIADGSTLEALFLKLKSLEDLKTGQLAGKICTVIDLVTRLPIEVWFHTNPAASETNFELPLLNLLSAKTLILLDLRFINLKKSEAFLNYSTSPLIYLGGGTGKALPVLGFALFSKEKTVTEVFIIFIFFNNLLTKKFILLLV